METNENSAVGVFDNLEKAERTIDELRKAGFASEEIGIIGHIGTDPGLPLPSAMNAPEANAIAGVWKGGVLGSIVGLVVIVVVPQLEMIHGSSRLMEIIGGGVLGAVVGCTLLAFASLAFSRPRSRLYAQELEKGRVIVTVKNPARKDEAVNLLRRQGIYVEKSLTESRTGNR